jgi:hypothetical protein
MQLEAEDRNTHDNTGDKCNGLTLALTLGLGAILSGSPVAEVTAHSAVVVLPRNIREILVSSHWAKCAIVSHAVPSLRAYDYKGRGEGT